MALETRCMKVRLKPGSAARAREWAAELARRRDEALATLRDEGVVVESVFLDSSSDGDFLIYYLKAESFERAAAVVRQSTRDIDAYHKVFMDDTWESRTRLELLVDLDRIGEAYGDPARLAQENEHDNGVDDSAGDCYEVAVHDSR